MTYEAFVKLVERLWEEVPEDFKRGLQGVHVFPEAKPEPDADPLGKNPVRYGDWELKGIAVDF